MIPASTSGFSLLVYLASNEPLFPAEARSEMKSEVKPSKFVRKGKGRGEEGGILNETEAARCLFEPVQSHDDPLHISTHGEQLIDLLLRCVK